MNILITGVAGFIGYNLSSFLLKKKHRVYGIDNFDNYYSIEIKKKRTLELRKNKNFFFSKVDITNKKILKIYFKKKKIDLVIHLAAQAGVRYSLINPQKYIDVNIFGFLNYFAPLLCKTLACWWYHISIPYPNNKPYE